MSATSGPRINPATIQRSARAAARKPKATRGRSRRAWRGAAMWSGKPLFAALVLASLPAAAAEDLRALEVHGLRGQSVEQARRDRYECHNWAVAQTGQAPPATPVAAPPDRKSTRLNSSHSQISYAVFCLKKKKKKRQNTQIKKSK